MFDTIKPISMKVLRHTTLRRYKHYAMSLFLALSSHSSRCLQHCSDCSCKLRRGWRMPLVSRLGSIFKPLSYVRVVLHIIHDFLDTVGNLQVWEKTLNNSHNVKDGEICERQLVSKDEVALHPLGYVRQHFGHCLFSLFFDGCLFLFILFIKEFRDFPGDIRPHRLDHHINFKCLQFVITHETESLGKKSRNGRLLTKLLSINFQ